MKHVWRYWRIIGYGNCTWCNYGIPEWRVSWWTDERGTSTYCLPCLIKVREMYEGENKFLHGMLP